MSVPTASPLSAVAENLVAAVAGAPVRTGKRSRSEARAAALTKGASTLLDEITGSSQLGRTTPPHAARNLRGVFYHDNKPSAPPPDLVEASPQAGEPAVRVRAVDFRQRLDMLLATEDCARAAARKLYPRFEGDTTRLPGLLQLLEDRWGFPERVFPLLWTHLQRTTRYTDDLPHVEEEEWIEAFVRWLRVVRTRCERTKMSRQCFVQTQSGAERVKVYLQGSKLGEGSYGEVYMAFHKDLGVDRVVKSVPKAQLGMAEEQVEDEVNALKSLDHPHIVRIFEAFETEEKVHIVMDYAEGGDLASAIRKAQDQNSALPEAWVRDVAGQITSALEYMHSKAMIHCDLKPGNTMLLRPFDLAAAREGTSRPHALLVDFGLAEIFEERSLGGGPTQVKGTPSYLAPEGFEGRVNHKSDMWALGVMIFEMLQGYRPFKGTSNVFMLFGLIANTEPSLEGMQPLVQDLVRALMTKEPRGRPSAAECRQHGWFAEHRREAAARWASSQLLPSSCSACLTTFGQDSYFHRAVTFCIASALGMKEMQDLFEVFQAMDTDFSGYLSPEQLRAGLVHLGVQQDPVALMAMSDLDGDSQISITEFLAGALQLKEGASDKQIRYAFALFDLDGDGHISMDELRLMLSGDGPSADVLPDGQTAEQVMEEVSGGQGKISFASFRAYLTKARSTFPSRLPAGCLDVSGSGIEQDPVTALVHDLEHHGSGGGGSKEGGASFAPCREREAKGFPTFHTWLAELFEETHQSAGFGNLLVFVDRKLEAAYVAHYIRSTCQQMFLLALVFVLYACWSLTTEDWQWDPSIATWEKPPQISHHIAWLVLSASALSVMVVCALTLRHAHPSSEHGKDDAAARDADAVRLERALCAWACAVQWVGCFFANRFRVSVLFGSEADDVFDSLNSDYDLIVTMIGMLMFFSTRTHVRFVCVLPLAISCVLAYALTSTFLGVADSRCRGDDENWAWPAVLLMIMTGLCLSGHRAVEYHRRLTFLSLYASYSVLREVHGEADADLPTVPASSPETVQRSAGTATVAGTETRTVRMKRALDLVRRLSDSGELVSRPLRAALQSLVEVLQSTREDIAEVERLLVVDVETKLQQRGIAESAQDLLLPMFDALPSVERVSYRTRELQGFETSSSKGDSKSSKSGKAGGGEDIGGWDSMSGELEAARPWGWETLSGTASVESETARPLAVASGLLLVPAAATAATSSEGLDTPEAARAQARCLVEALLEEYAKGPHSAEARAALAVQVAHWIAHRIGLWPLLQPWERVALLVAALGLHCGAGVEKGGGSGTLVARDPLLAHAASASRLLAAIDRSGLGEAGLGGHLGPVRTLLRRLLARARPRCVLEDVHRMRAHFERDDQVPSAPAERAVLTSLVLAAADLSFLALPASQHRPWALLCQEEAAEGSLQDLAWIVDVRSVDVASWLRGLVEVLALPVYETLGLLDGAEAELAAPVRHLRENAKHWKVARLAALPARHPVVDFASSEQQDAAGSADEGRDGTPPRTSASAVMTVMTLPLGIDAAATLAEGTRASMPALRVLQGGDDAEQAEQQAQQTIVATLPPGQELDVGMTLRHDMSMSMSLPGTMPPATLPAGSLPLGATISGAPPLARTLGGGGALIGRKVDEIAAGGILGATTAGGLAEARQGDAAQPPLVPESPSLTRGNSHPINVVLSKPRAKLPGEVSPLSEEESIEEKWA